MSINTKNKKVNNHQTGRRMPVWMLIITDILLTLICLGLFLLYHLVLPRHLSTKEFVVATISEGQDATFQLPKKNNVEVSDNSDFNTEATINSESNNKSENLISETYNSNVKSDIKEELPVEITNYGNSDTLDIQGDTSEREYISNAEKSITELNNYKSDNIQFTTNKVEVGAGSNKITYYISDIYVTNVKYLKTAFANGEYGKNLKDATVTMAEENNALLAINGDFYGNNEIGVVIRNGVLYRTEVYDADICVLFIDGTLRTYKPEEFDVDQVLDEGAWQAWIFGPELLDGEGNVLSTFNSTYYLSKEHPRTAIGYVEPGHYVFLVVDGRDIGYSRGVTLSELAQIMSDAGCLSAYNLDGGKSSAMAYEDAYVNQPYEGGRSISDIIYVGE